MKSFMSTVIIVIAALTIVAACSPKTQPAAAPSPTLSAPVSTPASSIPPSTSQDPAWGKVVEAAKKEGMLTVYSYMMVGDTGLALSKAFETKYGIKVDIITGRGAEFLERLKTEKRLNQIVADFLQSSPIHVMNIKRDGLTRSLAGLPEIKQKENFIVDPLGLDPEGHLLGLYASVMTAYLNPNLVKPADEPKSWKALLDPKWKGKIVVTDPDTMPILNRLYVVFTRHLGFTEDYFLELGKQDLVFAPNQRENDAMVARGQYPMTITGGGVSTMGPMIAEGAPLAPIDMAEGVPSLANPTVTLMAKAPHPNATRLFFNWLMGKEGQDVHGKFRSAASIRKDVIDYSPATMKIQYSKLVKMGQQEEEEAAQVQSDKVLSKMWRKK